MKNENNVKDKASTNKDFWQEYRACVLKQGVPDAKAQWYVNWVESFASSQKRLPLKARTAEHVRAFLSNLENRANVEQWQVLLQSSALSRQLKKLKEIYYKGF